MAAYKVIQDVEAEDKLFGPLTLRQFIYAGVAAVCLYVSYFFLTHNAGFFMALTLPIALVSGFFAFPWGRDQPTEVWALAKIRFMLKPRRRIWNQSGVKELVTVTAPKQLDTHYTNGLSEIEVRSRLRALASTIDSRGWAIKNANLNLYGQSSMAGAASDRLIEPASLPQPVDSTDIQASDDILDEKNNANAHRLETMINQSTKAHHDRIVETMQKETTPAPQPNNYWFLNQPAPATNIPSDMVTFNTQVVTPGAAAQMAPGPTPAPTVDEATLLAQLETRKSQRPDYGHLHQIQPLSAQTPPPIAQPPAAQMPIPTPLITPTQTAALNPTSTPVAPPVTPAAQAAILHLASNDDLNVATIAREAERTNALQNEVVIKLH